MPRVMPRAHGLDDPQLADVHMAEVARAMGDTAQAKEMYEKYLAAEANGPFANAARATRRAHATAATAHHRPRFPRRVTRR